VAQKLDQDVFFRRLIATVYSALACCSRTRARCLRVGSKVRLKALRSRRTLALRLVKCSSHHWRGLGPLEATAGGRGGNIRPIVSAKACGFSGGGRVVKDGETNYGHN